MTSKTILTKKENTLIHGKREGNQKLLYNTY